MYDNFVTYRSKIFRPDELLAANKGSQKAISLVTEPADLEIANNILWQPIPSEPSDANATASATATLLVKDKKGEL